MDTATDTDSNSLPGAALDSASGEKYDGLGRSIQHVPPTLLPPPPMGAPVAARKNLDTEPADGVAGLRVLVQEFQAALKAEVEQATIRTFDESARLLSTATLRDIMRTRPDSPHCAFGKNLALDHRDKGEVKNLYARCKGAKCPHCCPYWITAVVIRTLDAFEWDDETTIFRHIFNPGAWTGSQRKRRLAGMYPKRHLTVVTDYEGTREVFTPRPVDGPASECGEEIEGNPLLAILDAFLRCPAYPSGFNRYGGIPGKTPVESGYRCVRLPLGVTPEDACKLLEGALGRPIEWFVQEHLRGGPFFRQFSAIGLTPDEIDRWQVAVEPWRQQADEEWREFLAEKARRRRVTAERLAMQSGRPPTEDEIRAWFE